MKFLESLTRPFAAVRSSTTKKARLSKLDAQITDEWFRSHFAFASDVVNEWLSEVVDMEKSRILDFGCGDGIMDLGMAVRHNAREVVGADLHDSNKYLADTARAQLGIELPANLQFKTMAPGTPLATLKPDAIFSWSVFEHVDSPLLPAIFLDLYNALPRGGRFFLQIEPLYYSPFGAHLSSLITQPWVHLLNTEDQLRTIILDTRLEDMSDEHKNKTFEVCSFPDFKQFLIKEYDSLNKLKLSELLALVQGAGFEIEKKWTNMLDIQPPAALLAQHTAEDLLTNEVRLLLKKA